MHVHDDPEKDSYKEVRSEEEDVEIQILELQEAYPIVV